MKNSFGSQLVLTLFGESHGEAIGFVLDGLAPGCAVSASSIEAALARRRPAGPLATARREKDAFRIVSGVKDGKATGTPLCLFIENEDTRSQDYEAIPYRPGHADYTADQKYHGFQDARGGGHFSGRLTAPLVAAGAILMDALQEKGVAVATHLLSIGKTEDRAFENIENDFSLLQTRAVPVLNEDAEKAMREEIAAAKASGDSVGGVLETAVTGVPGGVGEPWFDTVEGNLAHALFSIPAVKGVEFGAGFALAKRRGSEVNDALYQNEGGVYTKTGFAGGVFGGITSGMPIVFHTAFKPTPTIGVVQHTVDPHRNKEVDYAFGGRHDPCVAWRAPSVVDSVAALVIADMLAVRFGTDFLGPEKKA